MFHSCFNFFYSCCRLYTFIMIVWLSGGLGGLPNGLGQDFCMCNHFLHYFFFFLVTVSPLFRQLHHVLKGFTEYSQEVSLAGVASIQHKFTDRSTLPELIGNVVLPAVLDSATCMVRSGLCVIIRHIIKVADCAVPGQRLIDLLVCGFELIYLFVSVSASFLTHIWIF